MVYYWYHVLVIDVTRFPRSYFAYIRAHDCACRCQGEADDKWWRMDEPWECLQYTHVSCFLQYAFITVHSWYYRVSTKPLPKIHSFDRGFHLIRSGCLRPSIALTVQNRGLKHQSFIHLIGGSHSTVVVWWTAGQQVEWLILYLGHDSYQNSYYQTRWSPAYNARSWPKTPFINFMSY